MENKTHRFISTKYELYSMEYGNEVLIEKTEENRPLTFYTGCEMALPQFEEIAIKTPVGEDFSFDLAKGEAYGDYIGATIPLQNQEGQRFIARVIDITEDKVKVDLNHPLAGKELRFKGHIIENREATDEEVKEFFEKLNSHHCNGHCGCHKGEGDENNQCGCNGSDESNGEGCCCCGN